MPELPLVSGDQCVSALERIGCKVARIKGSHRGLSTGFAKGLFLGQKTAKRSL
jgi:predicted RNA binding protein YcfA (HicA-like mRNA interferase family)